MTSFCHLKLLQHLPFVEFIKDDFCHMHINARLQNATVIIVNNAQGIFISDHDLIRIDCPA